MPSREDHLPTPIETIILSCTLYADASADRWCSRVLRAGQPEPLPKIWLIPYRLLSLLITTLKRQSVSQSLVNNTPHIEEYPKMLHPYFPVIVTPKCFHNLAENLPHAKAALHKQSSFMSAQSVLTTWRIIYLLILKHPRTFQPGLRPRLHRSGPHGLINRPPHALPSSCDSGSAICGGDFTK